MSSHFNAKEELLKNVEIINTIFDITNQKRNATTEELKLLATYTGFGGLKCVLNPPHFSITQWVKSEQNLYPIVQNLHRIIKKACCSFQTTKKTFLLFRSKNQRIALYLSSSA